MSFDLGMLSCQQRDPRAVGSWAASAGSLERHTCLSVESGEAIDYRASGHSIDDLLYVIPTPFFFLPGKCHITHHFTRQCHGC